MNRIRWLLQYVSPIKWKFSMFLFLESLSVAAMILMVAMQKNIIDDLFIAKRYEEMPGILSILATAIFVYFIAHGVAYILRRMSEVEIRFLISRHLMSFYYKMPIKDYRQERIGKMVSYFTNEINQIIGLLCHKTESLSKNLIQISILVVIIGISEPLLLLFIGLISILYIRLGKKYAPQMKKKSAIVLENNTEVNVAIEEGISSSREAIAYHRNQWEMDKFKSIFAKFYESSMNFARIANKQMLSGESIMWFVHLFVLCYGGYLVFQENMSLGLFVILYQFSVQLLSAINNGYSSIVTLSGNLAAVDRVKQLCDSSIMKDGDRTIGSSIHSIAFDHVRFKYTEETADVLKEVTMDFPIGNKIAIVGISGGGKSTITQLLTRFYDPQEGHILINGIPLQELQTEDWLGRIAVVFQEPYLFPDTIKVNLTMGREDITEEQFISACKTAEIYDYITSLAEGIETFVGERGIQMSGGQRQRLAIARAILQEPEILILDEATSALDQETEKRLQHNIDLLGRNVTKIIIAHRLSTIQNADVIYVMQDGIVIEKGNHRELVGRDSAYKKLLMVQDQMVS